MKLFIADLKPGEVPFFQGHFKDLEVTCTQVSLDELPIPEDTDILCVRGHPDVTAELIAKVPHLKLICTRTTGYDHIDLKAAASKGITVCNVPHYGGVTVAEHTFALLLSLSRKTHQAYRRTIEGHFSLTGLLGSDLAGRTFGVVGTGEIGIHLVRMAKAFGMKVVAADAFPEAQKALDSGFEYVDVDTLVQSCNVIALACPLTPETHHMFNHARFAKMQKGTWFLNTARGPIVETEALLWALREGLVGAAGLDVLEGEELMLEDQVLKELTSDHIPESAPLIAGNLALMRHPNVIVTPHMAFYSEQALQRIQQITAENIRGYLSGKPQNTLS